MTLSVIIITKNESRHIGACIDSVAFADEIIVVDSSSTDDTCAIARQKGARVVCTEDWPGFGPQKNRALDLATSEWVLSIDADERVTPELGREIGGALRDPRADAYRIARLSSFCGRWIYHSGWWPDHVLRLFRRSKGRFSDDALHESVQFAGTPATLKSHLLHYPYEDMESLIAKINRYSSDAALMMHRKGRTAGPVRTLAHAAWTFLRIYVIRRGFLDGREGLVLAVAAAAGSFFRYGKLMLLNSSRK